MKINKKLFLFLFIPFTIAQAAEIKNTMDINAAYYFSNHEGYNINNGFAPVDYSNKDLDPSADDPGRTVGSIWGAVENEFIFSRRIKKHILQGDGSLTKNNYLSSKTSAYVSVIHSELTEEISLSPAAFFVLSAGSGIGTGWQLASFSGMGKNLPGAEYDSTQKESLEGFVYKFWGSTLIQFDLAAVWPGKWHHIVFAVKSKIEYMAYSNADRDEAWLWKNDSGQNFNGLKFYGTYILGYKMPGRITFAGLIADTEEFIDHNRSRSKLGDGGWGSDLAELKFGPIAKYKINDHSNITAILQFKRFPEYTRESLGNRYFEYRESTGSTYISLYRLALVYHYDF